MKKSILNLAILTLMMCVCQSSFAVIKVNPNAPKVEQASHFTPAQISTLNKTHVEQRLGRKLTFKEKIGLAIFKKQAKKRKQRDTDRPVPTDGFAAFGLLSSLISLFVFGLPLGILGVVLGGIGLTRINKSEVKLKGKKLAIAGIVIGLIGILIVTLFIFYYGDMLV